MKWTHGIAVCLFVIFFSGCAKKPAPKPVNVSVETVPIPQNDLEKSTREENRARVRALAEGVFQALYFPFDQASLSQEAQEKLAAMGRLMRQESILSVIVEGHADERGTAEYNLALSEKRAHAVKEYLTSYGVETFRIRIIGFGEERPAAHGQDEESWALNRRAEFRVAID